MEFFWNAVAELLFHLFLYVVKKCGAADYVDSVIDGLLERFDRRGAWVAMKMALSSAVVAVQCRATIVVLRVPEAVSGLFPLLYFSITWVPLSRLVINGAAWSIRHFTAGHPSLQLLAIASMVSGAALYCMANTIYAAAITLTEYARPTDLVHRFLTPVVALIAMQVFFPLTATTQTAVLVALSVAGGVALVVIDQFREHRRRVRLYGNMSYLHPPAAWRVRIVRDDFTPRR